MGFDKLLHTPRSPEGCEHDCKIMELALAIVFAHALPKCEALHIQKVNAGADS